MSRTQIVLKNDSMGDVPDDVMVEGSTLDVTLELEGGGHECTECGGSLARYPEMGFTDGWVHEHNGSSLCGGQTRMEVLDELDADEDYQYSRSDLDSVGIKYATVAPEGPGDWAKWIGATVGKNSLSVQISLGVPHGLLTMKVWRGEDENGRPVTFLSVPHPDESGEHVALIPHHLGSYIVGGE